MASPPPIAPTGTTAARVPVGRHAAQRLLDAAVAGAEAGVHSVISGTRACVARRISVVSLRIGSEMRAAAAACLARVPCGVRVGAGGGSGGAMAALLCWASVKITGCYKANGCREKGWLLIMQIITASYPAPILWYRSWHRHTPTARDVCPPLLVSRRIPNLTASACPRCEMGTVGMVV